MFNVKFIGNKNVFIINYLFIKSTVIDVILLYKNIILIII